MKFTKPEDIKALDREALEALIAEARAESVEINAISDEDFTDENLTDLESLVEFIDEAEARVSEIDTEAQARAERLAAARGKVTEPEAEAEPVDENESEDETEDDEQVDEHVDQEEKVPVAASAAPKRSVIKSAASKSTPPEVEVEDKPRATITAAADVPGLSTGAELADLDVVAEGFISRFAGMRRPTAWGKQGRFNRYGVASIKKGRSDGLTMDNPEYRSLQDLIQAAGNETRLDGGSLIAAGGWCAPSETVYDLCSLETTDGLWDVPEVGVSRGGLNFTKGPDFSAIYALGGFWQTEAQAEAGTEKDCWDVECPDFTDVRLDAVGLCIKAGILTNAAFPELVRRYIEGALIAQQHRVSGGLLTRAVAASTASTIANQFENAESILTALDIVIAGERERYRMGLSATLEVVLPHWVRQAIRGDLANRTGVDLLSVTDAQIATYFAIRGARVQFVYNWQPLTFSGTGSAGAVVDLPSTVQALVYPAGTWTKLTQDVISLDAVYDSTGLSTNTYTAIFAEEGVAIANTCFNSQVVTIPLQVTGRTGAADISHNWGTAPAGA